MKRKHYEQVINSNKITKTEYLICQSLRINNLSFCHHL